MSSSNAITVANAVVTELNAQQKTWTRQFTAQRGWLPIYKLENLQDLTVTVVARGREPIEMGAWARGLRRVTYLVEINVQQAAQTLTLTDLDALVNLVEKDITGFYLDFHYLSGFGPNVPANQQWSVDGVAFADDEIYSLVRLYDEGIFDSSLLLTIKGAQP